MQYDEPLVGSVAGVLSIVCAAIAFGPWHQPYQLRSVAAFRRRYGKRASRLLWLAVSVACLAASVAILSGFRPSYAVPSVAQDP